MSGDLMLNIVIGAIVVGGAVFFLVIVGACVALVVRQMTAGKATYNQRVAALSPEDLRTFSMLKASDQASLTWGASDDFLNRVS